MNLVIEFPGDRVVPWQRFGPIPQLFVGAATEQRLETFMAHWQVMQDLQHVEENSNRDRVQHNGLQRVDHLEQRD